MQSHGYLIYTVYTFIKLFTENLFRKIAQSKITQKRKSAILRVMKFANYCAKCFFAQRNKIFALSFANIAQKFCEWNP